MNRDRPDLQVSVLLSALACEGTHELHSGQPCIVLVKSCLLLKASVAAFRSMSKKNKLSTKRNRHTNDLKRELPVTTVISCCCH